MDLPIVLVVVVDEEGEKVEEGEGFTFLILEGKHPQATPKTKAVPAIKTQSIGNLDAKGSTKRRKRCSNRASTKADGVDIGFSFAASSFSGGAEEEDDEEREGEEVEEGESEEVEAEDGDEEESLDDDCSAK